MTPKEKPNIPLIHPRQFKKEYELTLYQLERLTHYPEQTISHWVASPQSSRYREPADAVKHHFGLLHLSMQRPSA